ncbi:MAG: S-layer homology domain-containing protein [Clostridia bacterium]|nr:S-layer homology domain-containing protein [Clostridia bacterium]
MKKAMVSFLIIVMMISSVSVSFASENEDAAAQYATQLSLFETDDYDAKISRAEFVKALCAVTNLSATVYTDPQLSDMDTSNSYYPYVARAITYGYFKRPESGMFKPNDPVYAYQAVSSFIDILGYRPAVESDDYNVDWVYGSKLGLLDGMELSKMDELTVGDAALICRNALNIDVMEQTKYGDDYAYAVSKGKNLLAKYWNAEYLEGIVKANNRTALMSQSDLDDGYVRIGEKNLKCGTSNAETLLGYQVKCWWAEDTIIYVEKTSNNNQVTITASKISEASKTEIVYDENDSEKKVKLSNEADVIYNNVAVYDFDVALLTPKTGYITLLDNNGDKKYDVIFIHEYKNYYAVGVNYSEGRIIDGIRNTVLEVNTDDDKRVAMYSYNFNTKSLYSTSLNTISKKNIISAEISLDGKDITLVRSDASFSGTITTLPASADGNEIIIDGTTYRISGDYMDAIASKQVPELELGKAGTFYLDYTGNIAYADFTNNGFRYGFLNKTSLDDAGFTHKFSIRLFSDEGEWVDYTFTKKLMINGESKTCSEAAAILASPQIIKYKENAEGAVTEIEVATDQSTQSGYPGYTEDVFTLDAVLSSQKYKSKDKSFNKKYSAEMTTTTLFVIPKTATDSDGCVDEDAIFVTDTSYFINDKTYDLKVYDSDEYFIPRVIVVTKGSEEPYQSRLFYINETYTALGDDGENVYTLSGYFKGAKCEYVCDDYDVFKNIRPGDALRIAYGSNGKLRLIDVVASLDPENNGSYAEYSINKPGTYDYGAAVGVYIGTAYNVDYKRNSLLLYTTDKNTIYKCVGSGSNVFWIFDTKDKEFKPASINDFEGEKYSNEPSRVFVSERYYEIKDLVVVK